MTRRLTWKRRSKKPARKNQPAASGESVCSDAAAGLHSPASALPGRDLSQENTES